MTLDPSLGQAQFYIILSAGNQRPLLPVPRSVGAGRLGDADRPDGEAVARAAAADGEPSTLYSEQLRRLRVRRGVDVRVRTRPAQPRGSLGAVAHPRRDLHQVGGSV